MAEGLVESFLFDKLAERDAAGRVAREGLSISFSGPQYGLGSEAGLNLDQFLAAIRRELGNLLGTRTHWDSCAIEEPESTCLTLPSSLRPTVACRLDDYLHLCSSVISYGLPDTSGLYAHEADLSVVEELIRTAISRFEPRIVPDGDKLIVRAFGGSQEAGRAEATAVDARFGRQFAIQATVVADSIEEERQFLVMFGTSDSEVRVS